MQSLDYWLSNLPHSSMASLARCLRAVWCFVCNLELHVNFITMQNWTPFWILFTGSLSCHLRGMVSERYYWNVQVHELGNGFRFVLWEETQHHHCVINAIWERCFTSLPLYSFWYILLINTLKCPIVPGSVF